MPTPKAVTIGEVLQLANDKRKGQRCWKRSPTVARDAEGGYFGEIAFPNHVGHPWMRQGWECLGALADGTTYTDGGRRRSCATRST